MTKCAALCCLKSAEKCTEIRFKRSYYISVCCEFVMVNLFLMCTYFNCLNMTKAAYTESCVFRGSALDASHIIC